MRFLALLLYALFAGLVLIKSDCLVFGLPLAIGPVLLLDRTVVRLLPWPDAVSSPWMPWILRGASAVALGQLPFVVAYPMISLSEALFCGLVAVLGLGIVGDLIDLLRGVLRWARPAAKPLSAAWVGTLTVFAIITVVALLQPILVFHPLHRCVIGAQRSSWGPHEEVVITTADGLSLPGSLFTQPDAVGSVVFCHGHGGNRGQVGHLLPIFQKLRLNVLACDFRAHGESPGRVATFGIREVEDVVAGEAFLRNRYPEKPTFLVGISYGASVVIQALPRLPHVRAAWVESGFARLTDLADHVLPGADGPLGLTLLGGYDVIMRINSGFSPLQVRPIDQLAGTRVPILFCHGREDDYVYFREGVEMYETYNGPKECYWVTGAGHHDLFYRAGREYENRFLRYFRAHLGTMTEPQATGTESGARP